MAAASGLDKFRFIDDLAKMDPDQAASEARSVASSGALTNSNGNDQTAQNSPNSPNSATAAAAAAAAASRLLSLQRDLSGGQVNSPMDFLKQLEASSRGGRGGFDRLMSLVGFGFPGLMPPLAPLQNPETLKSAELDVEAIASAHLAATEKQIQEGKFLSCNHSRVLAPRSKHYRLSVG